MAPLRWFQLLWMLPPMLPQFRPPWGGTSGCATGSTAAGGDSSSSQTPSVPGTSSVHLGSASQSRDDQSLLNERNAAIDIIISKKICNEELRTDLEECKKLISSLRTTIQTMDAAWELDKAELTRLRKQIENMSSNRRVKLSIIGDSHVHHLEPIMSKVFPGTYDIKCYPKSGSGFSDICVNMVLRIL
ncbi:hypothetical protein M8J77_026433 [Diaphorina citri]|nr:hypothetical protein M8J77_026433 [Diaphorina citri]